MDGGKGSPHLAWNVFSLGLTWLTFPQPSSMPPWVPAAHKRALLALSPATWGLAWLQQLFIETKEGGEGEEGQGRWLPGDEAIGLFHNC